MLYALLSTLLLAGAAASAAHAAPAAAAHSAVAPRNEKRPFSIALLQSPPAGGVGSAGGVLTSASGKRLAGYRLRFVRLPIGSTPPRFVVAGVGGQFHVDRLPSGNYLVFVSIPEGPNFVVPSPGALTITPGSRAEGLRLVSQAGSEVSGRIVDAAGRPVIGARVGLAPPGSDDIGLSTQTDTHGVFKVRVKQGQWNVFAVRPVPENRLYLVAANKLGGPVQVQDGAVYNAGDLRLP